MGGPLMVQRDRILAANVVTLCQTGTGGKWNRRGGNVQRCIESLSSLTLASLELTRAGFLLPIHYRGGPSLTYPARLFVGLRFFGFSFLFAVICVGMLKIIL